MASIIIPICPDDINDNGTEKAPSPIAIITEAIIFIYQPILVKTKKIDAPRAIPSIKGIQK